MADGEGLRERLGEIVRASAVNQARVYRDYGALLDRLGSRDIKTAQFAREAVDLYMGALGKAASTGVTLLSETLSAGMKGVGIAASATAEAAQAAQKEVARDNAAKPGPARRSGSAPAT
jgi:hypothetical protein